MGSLWTRENATDTKKNGRKMIGRKMKHSSQSINSTVFIFLPPIFLPFARF